MRVEYPTPESTPVARGRAGHTFSRKKGKAQRAGFMARRHMSNIALKRCFLELEHTHTHIHTTPILY